MIYAIVAFLIVLLLIVFWTLFVFFGKEKDPETVAVNYAFDRFPSKVCNLLKLGTLPAKDSLDENQKELIAGLTTSDWLEWDGCLFKAEAVAKANPLIFQLYVEQNFPDLTKRKSYKAPQNIFSSTQTKNSAMINAMTLEELRLVLSETEESWERLRMLNSKVSFIKRSYKEGYEMFMAKSKCSHSDFTFIVQNRNKIEQYQIQIKVAKAFDGFEKRQEEFCSKLWKLYDELAKNNGRYTYKVSFKKIKADGTLEESSFKIWQGFISSYAPTHLEEQNEYYKKRYSNIPEFKNRTRYFVNETYSPIIEIISNLNSDFHDVLIVFVTSSKQNWELRTYDYHYKYLKSEIADLGVESCNLNDLTNYTDKEWDVVLVIDFITVNEDLKLNAKLVIEAFDKGNKVPCIGYYTMIKEYSEEEIIEIIKTDKKKIEQQKEKTEKKETEDIVFVKRMLLKAEKHSYFVYLAITNTLIGEASGAQETKTVWLTSPNKYAFKTEEKNGYISGEYSVDGGITFKRLETKGSEDNIDDMAIYTYRLFSSMGILEQFKAKGEKAINFMNARGFIKYH